MPSFELKKLSREGVTAALEKAQRYRLLNEPHEAESICLDILAIDPSNHDARITLILALSDQLDEDASRFDQAYDLVCTLAGYERHYFEGLLYERRAKALYKAAGPQAGNIAYDWFRRAMEKYEAAAANHPPGNEDAILRWNTCARLLQRHADLRPATVDRTEEILGE